MNIKKSLLLFAPLCASLLMVSCNGGGEPVVSDKGIITTPTEILFKTTAGKQNQAALNRMIEDFKKIEPNVTANVVSLLCPILSKIDTINGTNTKSAKVLLSSDDKIIITLEVTTIKIVSLPFSFLAILLTKALYDLVLDKIP